MKRSIYCGEPIERLLKERAGDDSGLRSVSGVLNATADRYLEVVRRSMPRFSVAEWGLIFDSMNGVWMQDQAALVGGALALGVSDSISLNRLDDKWDVDGRALVGKLGELSYCSQVAVIDAAERFWAKPSAGDLHQTVAAVVGKNSING